MSDNIRPGLVSVIIPCYNQGHFLHEAIASVRSQTYSDYEIIVIDDGSTEYLDELRLACAAPHVQCWRQENKGLAGARNAGFVHSRGEFVVFLDADDRLLARALEVGIRTLSGNPAAAAVYGHYRQIARDGSFLVDGEAPYKGSDHYERLLRSNFIATPASVLYRRSAFEKVGLFDETLSPAADYDMYLRISREFPLCAHDETVAEYRQHGFNMSCNSGLMLDSVLKVLEKQKPHAQRDVILCEALKSGINCWHSYYGGLLADAVHAHVLEANWKFALRDLLSLMQRCPDRVATGKLKETFETLVRSITRPAAQIDPEQNSRPEKLFSRAPKGCREAPWINAGAIYEFRLYGGTNASTLLASVPVTRNASGVRPFQPVPEVSQRPGAFINASPNPIPPGTGAGSTQIEWNAGGESAAEVRLCVIPLPSRDLSPK
jgi:glycosyltransferase involved in cell wall biosynthesis